MIRAEKLGNFGKSREEDGVAWCGFVAMVFTGKATLSLSLSLAMRCSTVDRFMGIALSPMAQSKRESNGGRSARAQFHRA